MTKINEEPIDNPELADAIRSLANKRFGRTKRKTKSTTPEKGDKLKSGWSKTELTHYNAESAELAQIGMAAMGGMLAHSIIHHATGTAMHAASHHIKKIIDKVKSKRSGKIAAVKDGTSKAGTPANDNSPSTKPKIKITMQHGEEKTYDQMMLERAKKLGIANQIAYYAGKVNAEKA